METTIGHMTDRKNHIAELAQSLRTLCITPLTDTPDIFGCLETVSGRNHNIELAAKRIARVAAMNDLAWDELTSTTADQVREADHPKHSIL